MTYIDAERAQLIRRADAGQLQQLRRVVGPPGEDHFLAGADLSRDAASPAFDIAHADCALAVEDNLSRMRVGVHMDIGPLHRWAQECCRRADAPAIPDRALRVRYAFLNCAVVIGVARDAERNRAGHERLAERILPVHGGHGQITLAPTIGVLALADAPLQPPEIGQHIRIAPAAIAELRPGIEILALAAIVDVTIDRGGSAERLAARRVDAAAAG